METMKLPPVQAACVWRGIDLEANRSWEFSLSEAQKAELETALQTIQDRGLRLAEITSEHAIRGTFCDLAVKVEGALALLIEVKAVGHELRDQIGRAHV